MSVDEAGKERVWRRLAHSWRVHLLLLALVTCAHWIPRLRGPIDLRYDGGVYYVLGTALAEGKGYRLLNEPGEIQAIQYPPLLPAGIALLQRVLGTADVGVVGRTLRWASLFGSLLYAGAVYALARRLTEPGWALFVALLASLGFHTVFLEDLCFTEVPFALLTVGFFWCLVSQRKAARVGAGVLAVAAFFLRSAGVTLFLAWTLTALLKRRWRSAAVRGLLGAVCLLAWQGYVASVRSGRAYRQPAYEYQRAPYLFYNVSYGENLALLDPFTPEAGELTSTRLLRRLPETLARLVIGLGETVSTTRAFWEWPLQSARRRFGVSLPGVLVAIPLAALGLGVLAGLLLLWRRGEHTLVLYAAGSMGIIALLPWPAQIPRYLMPLTPFLALALASSLTAAGRRSRGARLAVGGVCALVLGTQVFALERTFTHYHVPLRTPDRTRAGHAEAYFFFGEAREWRGFYALLERLAREAPPGAVIASSSPQLVWLHTGHPAVMPPFEADPAEACRLLDTVPVEFVIVDGLSFIDVTRRYARPALQSRPDLWELVASDPEASLELYRRRH